MHFVCTMDYMDDGDALLRARPAHRAYMRGLIERGVALLAGSFVPDGEGGLFLYAAHDRAAAERLILDDPYVTGGIARSWTLREYEIHGASADRLATAPR